MALPAEGCASPKFTQSWHALCPCPQAKTSIPLLFHFFYSQLAGNYSPLAHDLPMKPFMETPTCF
uniref:Uncharacterized protein n=1 Tax=mine drainage metagenome TaxID=410659 RepID=E6PWR8_9ZZZZ